jgi:hypothetical protein
MALVGSVFAQQDAQAVPAKRPAPRVTVVIAVDDCEGCKLDVLRGDEWDWRAKGVRGDLTVKDGKVTFTLPKAHTKGLVFGLHDPNAVDTHAVPIVVIRYASQKAGHAMGKKRAVRGRHAYFCTAPVRKATVHWHIRVAHVPVKGGGYDIRPFFSPGLRIYGTPMTLPKKARGGLQVNGDFYCKESR